ncbi:alpha-N-acetylneuraminide alpha-2,8-sialyltransferase [Cricetulus griseus]|uniref:Alpha-N-acetylneuraminide alpha-2,8-sialyltransferase n=1 Tax=Cricetulus griseus TaxID=10029 RepID=A0A8C2QBV9_CRIGR|nr:alpha-N-acetylneuraminide alpha-2,8-sialyltransferase [Cricetulus griseus]XP_027285959.1 alpha-N-acetylneuraminide alpha-2,8-sialyltransferase [Cricetulus griseus]
MSPCGRARRHTSRGAMAMLTWKFPRTRLPVGASALCVVVLCWLYVFPVYRLPNEKEIVQGVQAQRTAWRRNQTAARLFRKQMEDCCDPAHLFAMTKMNSPMGKSLWYDGEFLYSFTIDNSTYSLFPQETPFQLPLKTCAVVGNGGILKMSGCGRQIDEANFVMRCNLPPLSSEYTRDVGSKTQLVTANPSIIRQRFQNLLWSRKMFVDSMKIYNHSYIYMPAFSMKTGTEPSLRVYYTLKDVGANQTVLFANPNFLRSIGKFWKSRGIHAKRLSTGLFLVSAALGLCEEVAIYGFWPFSVNMHEEPISHHYYDNVLPYSGFHAMPEEFLQLWYLHKIGALRMQLGPCEEPSLQPTS